MLQHTHRCKGVEFPTEQITQKIYIWIIHLYKQNMQSLGPVTLAHICSQGPLLNPETTFFIFIRRIFTQHEISKLKYVPENTIQQFIERNWKERELEFLFHIPESLDPILFYFCCYSTGREPKALCILGNVLPLNYISSLLLINLCYWVIHFCMFTICGIDPPACP